MNVGINFCFNMKFFIAAALLLTFALPLQASDDQVYIALWEDGDNVEKGQGLFMKRGAECLVIAPKHLFTENRGADIKLTLGDKTIVNAEVIEKYAEDIAILRPDANTTYPCRSQPFSNIQLDQLIDASTKATLHRRDAKGNVKLLHVRINTYDTYKSITVIPDATSGNLKQGYSGSSLFIDGHNVGMLTDINTETDNVGIVMQSRTLNSIVSPFFNAVSNDNEVALLLDKNSQFLRDALLESMDENRYNESKSSNEGVLKLHAESRYETIDSDTDKLVRLYVTLDIVNPLGNSIYSKQIVETGNSFVSLDKARSNAEKLALKKLLKIDPFYALQ